MATLEDYDGNVISTGELSQLKDMAIDMMKKEELCSAYITDGDRLYHIFWNAGNISWRLLQDEYGGVDEPAIALRTSMKKSRYDDFKYWGRTHFDTCPAWASDKRVLFDETVDGYCMHMESDTPMTEYDFNRITHELESGGSFTNIQISEPQQGNYKQYLYILTADDGMDGGYESMLDELVEISGTPYYDGITLGQAIEIYGIDKEGNPDDTRAFARCPKLKGLCGPSFPNHGFVARYDTWESYNLLSTSTRKSFRSLLAEQRNKRGRQIW